MKPLRKHTDRELILKLVNALNFYGDPETWFAVLLFPDPPNGPIMEDFSKTPVYGVKPGKRARRVLGPAMARELNRRWPVPKKKKMR